MYKNLKPIGHKSNDLSIFSVFYSEKNTGLNSPAGGVTKAEKLDFKLNNDILDDIEKAKEAADR